MTETKKRKPKAIVLDYDDTVVGFIKTVLDIHNAKFNTCLSESDITSWNFEGLEIKDAIGNTVLGTDINSTFKYFEDEGLYAVLEPLSGAELALDLMKRAGYKVIILTARPEKYRVQTELNLIRKKLVFDEIHFNSDKVSVLNELSHKYKIVAFVDDKLSTVENVAENCKVSKVCVVNTAANEKCEIENADIVRVNDLIDVLRVIKTIVK